MSNWKKILLDYAERNGLEKYDTSFGVGIGYSDGFDVFWVLPGEFFSTVECAADGPEPDRDLIAEYTAIDRVRGEAIHVLRHHLAENDVPVARHQSGFWQVPDRELDLGEPLTAMVLAKRDVGRVLEKFLVESGLPRIPDADRLEQYQQMPLPPVGERKHVKEEEPEKPAPECNEKLSIAEVAENMIACVECDGKKQLRQFAAKKWTEKVIGEVLRLLDELLPDRTAWCHMLTPSVLDIEYADGYDSFRIDTSSVEFGSVRKKQGTKGMARELANRFLRLEGLRSEVLHAIWAAAIENGWSYDEVRGFEVFGVPSVIGFGKTFLEFELQVGQVLSQTLETTSPADLFRAWFAGHPEFAELCVDKLKQSAEERIGKLPEKRLLFDGVNGRRDRLPLLEITEERIRELDAYSKKVIEELLKDKKSVSCYLNKKCYNPAIDAWCTQEDWVDMAKRQLADVDYLHLQSAAILILLDAGDPLGDREAREYLGYCKPRDHDADEAEAEIVWRYRHEYPDVALEWFGKDGWFAEDKGFVPFKEARATWGDPVAARRIRHCNMTITDIGEDFYLADRRILTELSNTQREKLHRELVNFVSVQNDWFHTDYNYLDAARVLGFTDVTTVMQENPKLLSIYLGSDSGAMEVLCSCGFLLVWSCLLPGTFLARLLLTLKKADFVELHKQGTLRFAKDGLFPPDGLDKLLSDNKARESVKDFELAFAIAWTRCRRYLD